ncbi:hypothetical protein KR018_000117 [Drosophila ironensis]|nr:hypothetical protein KR018_000117 [Drosophila ironensis]
MQIPWLLLWAVLVATASSRPESDPKKLAEIAKLRSELNQALEDNDGAPEGVVVAPTWTQEKGGHPAKASPVLVSPENLGKAASWRQEIQRAVQQQGHAPEVVRLEVEFRDKARSSGSLGGTHQPAADLEPNVVDSWNALPGIDLEQLQRLELSKRRSRDMLILSRIEEQLNWTLPGQVQRFWGLQANGSSYIIAQQDDTRLQLLSRELQGLQDYQHPSPVEAVLTLEGLLLLKSQEKLTWLRLDQGEDPPRLVPFWEWPLSGEATHMAGFQLEGVHHLALAGRRTLSIYAYRSEAAEFWIAQRLQMPEEISDLGVLDAGRELLVAIGQPQETRVYGWGGGSLKLRQQVDSPQVTGLAAFQMGGRSYLALGGQRPQILAYQQGRLLPRTILGQNFGFVERFLAVPVRSYRDDLLLLVQHRVRFDPHTLLVLEVLVWNGEAFEAGLPPPCGPVFGANCLLDQEADVGIEGAALLRQRDQPPLVLVPRKMASSSGVFRLETQLLGRNSESQDLQEIHQFMQNWIGEQEKLLQLAEELDLGEQGAYEDVATDLVISEGGSVQQLWLNEEPWTAADAGLDLRQLLHEIALLDEELGAPGISRVRRQAEGLFNFHYERLEVEAIEAGDLLVDQLNHTPMFVRNASLILPPDGSLNAQNLTVLEAPEEQLPAKGARNETHEALALSGNLEFVYINGLKWSQLLEDLVWRHQPLKLNQLLVSGPVIFEDALHVDTLNELNFPEDFLWSQDNATSVVIAPKEFTQTLSANAVDTSGSVNGRNPWDAITLSDGQDWPGRVTFSHLEVSEQLELNGTAQGRQFEEAPLNPTLQDSHRLQADCHFDQLWVRGALRLTGQLENQSLDSLLQDLVQRSPNSENELQVGGWKRVNQLILPVDSHVEDGQLSGLPVAEFVTKHTNQTLANLTQLHGYVYFHELELPEGSRYDGVRLEELLAEGIRLDVAQVSPSPLTRLRFEGPPPELEQLQVVHSLNKVPLASGFQLLHEPLHLVAGNFTRLAAEQAQVNRDVSGTGLLNGHHLDQLLQEQPRTWSGEVHVQELVLPQGILAEELQGLRADLLLDFLHQLDDLPLLILQGRLQVDRMAVTGGSVLLEAPLNGRHFAELQRQAVWLDRPNELHTRWNLRQAPDLQANLRVLGSFNDRLLPDLLDDIVFRPDPGQELVIAGPKSFRAPLQADHLQLVALNGVPFEHLATKDKSPLVLKGSVRLEGRLFVEDLQLPGQEQLEQLLRWDPRQGAFIRRGLVELPRQEGLENLTVLGHLGNRSREPLGELFGQLIFKRQPGIELRGHKTFTGRVRLEGGAFVGTLNGLDLEQLLDQLIFVDSAGQEAVVETPVTFTAPVQMGQLQAERLVLTGGLLNGCNVSQWLGDTLRVDRDWQGSGVTFAPGSLDGNHLEVELLNGLNLSQVVTTNKEQWLSEPLKAEELFLDNGNLEVRGLVNGRNLSEEFANTLMTSGVAQTVETPLILASINVSGYLEASTPVNGWNLSDVATLGGEPLVLQSPLYFAELHAPFLKAGHPLNGFQFQDWYERSLWARGREQQEITGSWRVKRLRMKQAEDLRPRRQTSWDLCQQLARMLQLPYQLQKLSRSFSLKQLPEQEAVRRVFALEAGGSHFYLLVNERGCWTRILRWNDSNFQAAGAFQSGPIDEVVALQVGNKTSEREFTFMTSHESTEDEDAEPGWNCTGLSASLGSWRISEGQAATKPLDISLATLRSLKDQQEQRKKSPPLANPSYQQVILHLQGPRIGSQLGAEWQRSRDKELMPEELGRMRGRLLDTLERQLRAEMSIIQLSIPESDLYDEHLVEDFLELTQQLGHLRLDTLPLPDTPAKVLAARSAQLMWPVLRELRGLTKNPEDVQAHMLEQALLDVLQMANGGSPASEEEKLHAVIERLRRLHQELHQEEDPDEPEAADAQQKEYLLPLSWRPVETVRLIVGPALRPKLLYARLTLISAPEGPPPTTPSSAPEAHIQVHHANGSLFQSLAAERGARHLVTLRVRDETLLAFVEGCCRVRVLIYRGVQGFVPFARFRAPRQTGAGESHEVLQLLTMRLPLRRPPGAMYSLAVVQSRRITFYELVIAGLLEPWIKC